MQSTRGVLHLAAGALALALLASGCGGGGGGTAGGTGSSGTSTIPVPQTPAAPPDMTPSHFGLALFGDDSYGPGELQVVSLFDSSGGVAAKPALATVSFPFMFDYEDMSIAPNGSYGLVADGARTLRVISGIDTGKPAVSSYTLDVTPYGNDLDAVSVLPNGDEAVVAADTNNSLLEVSGLQSGKPVAAQSISTPDLRNGLVLSQDGKVLMARGYSGVTVYAVTAVAPVKGTYGGWTYHAFAQTQNLTALPALDAADARAGMAISPKDSSRAVVVGAGPKIALITGLPQQAQVQTSAISGATNAYAAAISPDGTTAFVGTDKGIAVFSGVDTGTLKQVQSVSIPAGNGDALTQVTTLGVTPDGGYVVAVGHSASSPTSSSGYLTVLPVTASGLGAPAGLLSGVFVPGNDQMLVQ